MLPHGCHVASPTFLPMGVTHCRRGEGDSPTDGSVGLPGNGRTQSQALPLSPELQAVSVLSFPGRSVDVCPGLRPVKKLNILAVDFRRETSQPMSQHSVILSLSSIESLRSTYWHSRRLACRSGSDSSCIVASRPECRTCMDGFDRA